MHAIMPTKASAKETNDRLKAQRLRHKPSAKVLGVGTSGGRRRCTLVLQKRFQTVKKCLKKVRKLRAIGVNTVQWITAAANPKKAIRCRL